jgi:hypothetical protein
MSMETIEPFDFERAAGMVIRWKLAQACLANLKVGAMPGERALQILVDDDVPRIIDELFRLRPELQVELRSALEQAEVA